MAFSAGSSSAASSEINVTPLIDVLLVLLIIFMVIAPTMRRGLDSSIPQGHATSATLPPLVVQVVAGVAGQPLRYQIDRRVMDLAELRGVMGSMLAVRQDRTLFVEADRALTYQQVAAVVGMAREQGAGGVVLGARDSKQ